MGRAGNTKIGPKTLHIVIPVHNRRTYTLHCLRSLSRQTITGFHVIVVDDGSTDGTSDAVLAEFPEVVILKGDGNLWWSGAMNVGVRHALAQGGEYVLSLNDDLEAAEDYIEKMIFQAEQKPSALFGSYIFDIKTGRPFAAGRRIDWRTGRNHSLLTIVPEEKRKGIYRASDFSGRGLWIPSGVFKQIGLFDAKHLPHYGADNDFTLRAARYGFEIYCNFDAVLYSYVEAAGQYRYKGKYSIGNYYHHLFGIKGSGNLKNFTIIAFRHCPKKYLPWYWLYGVVRQAGGYLINWGRYTVRNSFIKQGQYSNSAGP